MWLIYHFTFHNIYHAVNRPYDYVIIIIIIIIIIKCSWVVTWWQWLFYAYTNYEIIY